MSDLDRYIRRGDVRAVRSRSPAARARRTGRATDMPR